MVTDLVNLEKIPEEWDVKPISELIRKDGLIRGPFGGLLKKSFFIKSGIKVYEQKNAIARDFSLGTYYISEKMFLKLKRFEVQSGDFIVSCSGTIGRIFLLPEKSPKGIINQALLLIKINTNVIDKRYFLNYFVWEKFQEKIIDSTQGGAMKNLVGMKIFRNILIGLPKDPKEQARISTIISDADELIKQLDRLITKKKNIKQGAMQELLTGKRRLKGFNEKWLTKKLGDIAEIKDGTHQTPTYVSHGIPFYSVENVTDDNFTNTKYVSEKEHQFLTKSFKIEKGDILMTRIGSIGDCKLVDWDVNASFYVSLALLKIKKEVSSAFVYQYTKSNSFKKEAVIRSLQWAVPKKINLGDISEIEIDLPPLKEEQNRIAEMLYDMDSEIQELEKNRDKYVMIKNGMMQKLLTGEIRVK